MTPEYMPVKPYWLTTNESEDELRAKLKELNRALDLVNPPTPPLSWRDRTRAEQELKRVKRLLSEAESRRLHERVQMRRAVVAEQTTCGLRRTFVPDHVEWARCEAEKQFISNSIPRRFMPPTQPTPPTPPGR